MNVCRIFPDGTVMHLQMIFNMGTRLIITIILNF